MRERSDAARPYSYWDGRQLRKGIIGGVGVCGCGHGANTGMPGTSFWEKGVKECNSGFWENGKPGGKIKCSFVVL